MGSKLLVTMALTLAALTAWEGKAGAETEIVLGKDGDSVRPTYRIDIDPRWTKSMFATADALKAICGNPDCGIARLVKVLPYAAEMSAHCPTSGAFSDRFYCLAMGATAAQLIEVAGLGDAKVFISENRQDGTDLPKAAGVALVKAIAAVCTEDSVPKGCAVAEAKRRLGSSEVSLSDCTGYEDWETVSCLMIGRMSEFLDKAAAAI